MSKTNHEKIQPLNNLFRFQLYWRFKNDKNLNLSDILH